MKKLVVLIGMFFAFLFIANAQEKKKAVFLYKQETMDIIGLDLDQQKKITEITQKSFKDLKKINEDQNLSEAEKKTQRSSIWRQRTKDFEKVLTKQQLKKFNKLKEDVKKGR